MKKTWKLRSFFSKILAVVGIVVVLVSSLLIPASADQYNNDYVDPDEFDIHDVLVPVVPMRFMTFQNSGQGQSLLAGSNNYYFADAISQTEQTRVDDYYRFYTGSTYYNIPIVTYITPGPVMAESGGFEWAFIQQNWTDSNLQLLNGGFTLSFSDVIFPNDKTFDEKNPYLELWGGGSQALVTWTVTWVEPGPDKLPVTRSAGFSKTVALENPESGSFTYIPLIPTVNLDYGESLLDFGGLDYSYITNLDVSVVPTGKYDSSLYLGQFKMHYFAVRDYYGTWGDDMLTKFYNQPEFERRVVINNTVDADFGSWLVTAIGGFMEFEIFPGFSLVNILVIVMSLFLMFAFLRYFAGG